MRKIFLLFCVAVGAGLFAPLSTRAADNCEPSGTLQFVCVPSHPEDLVLVPHTHWIIASGAHLYLVNADSKVWKEAYPGESPTQEPDRIFADCPGAPDDPKKLLSVGLAIRETSPGISTLFAVGRGDAHG